MKKTLPPLFLFILIAGLAWAIPAAAQNNPELSLRLSRDFGYASGSGKIQGTFSLKASGPEDLARVEFLLDGQKLGEDTQPPFGLKFSTGNYSLGVHTLSATGFTAGGRELHSNEIRAEFVTAQEGMQAGLKIVVPLLVILLGVALLSVIVPFALRGGKKLETPLGEPHNYGAAGGAICPRCSRPFPLPFLSPNLGPFHKFASCPYCGKVGLMRRRSITDLRAAEAAELEQAQAEGQVPVMSEEEKLRKELENSRYQNM